MPSRRLIVVVAGVAAAVAGAAVALLALGDRATAWSGTPEVYQVNRLDPTVRTVPVEDATAVLKLGAHEAEEVSPWRLDMDGEWAFRWSPSVDDASLDFTDPATDVADWDTVEVPHQWQLDGYGDPETGDLAYLDARYPWDGYGEISPGETPSEGASVGSYRREVTVPEDWDGRRVVLAFQGVKSAFTVWVNGVEIGYSEDSYAPAEFDVTEAMWPGSNTVAVLVHRWSDGSWLENQDMIDLSGIFRGVDLYATLPTYIRDHTITTDVADELGSATVAAEAEVVDAVDAPGDSLRATLVDADGAAVGEDVAGLVDGGGSIVGARVAIEVPDARLWSAEDPYLYTLIYEILDGDTVVETVATRVGIREFGIVDGLMTLNGRPLDIKGVNHHDSHADTGQAVTEEQLREDLTLMRQHNITAVRTSHYPASPDLYRLADEIGLYIMSEANLETHGLRPFPDGATEWDAAVLDRIVAMQERDKNHASVLWWSLGNEIGPGEVFARGADLLRELDPTRLVHFQEDSSIADVDGIFYPTLAELEETAAAGATGRPWLMTEYQNALGNSLGGIEQFWRVIDSADFMQGGFVWSWADQAVRLPIDGGVAALPVGDDAPADSTFLSYGRDWGDYPSDGAFELTGLVSADRQVQSELVDLAAVYAPVELVDTDLGAGRIRIRNEHLVTDLADLDATWVLEADGVTVDGGPLEVALPAGETGWIDLPVSEPSAPVPGATYRVTVTFALAEGSAWAPAGHGVAALQATMPWETGEVPVAVAPGPLEAVESVDSIEIADDGFSATVDRATGALTSYVIDGRELLAGPTHPDFWRAPTQDDQMNGTLDAQARWRDAGDALTDVTVDVARSSADVAVITVAATVPLGGGIPYGLTYTVSGDGSIGIEATLGAAPELRSVPAVGLEIPLVGDLGRLEWLGAGPHATWPDRDAGALTRWWESTVEEQVEPFAKPQAMGNLTGVERLTLTDASGTGLAVTAVGEAFQASTLPFTEAAIEAAAHPFQIARDGAVHLTLDAAQQGLGTSWGVQPDHMVVPADVPHRLAVTLEPVRP